MPDILIAAVYIYFGLTISFQDFNYHLIRNQSLMKFLVSSSATFIIGGRSVSFVVICFATLFAILLRLLFAENIGAGDLKLFIALSMWSSNVESWLSSFTISWILGGLVSAVVLLRKRQLKRRFAFAPFVFLGFLPAI